MKKQFYINHASHLKIISVVIPDPKIFFWIAASVVDAAAVNPSSIKALLAHDLSTFFIKDKPLFNNGPESLPRNPPDGPILYIWVFDNFILAEELFTKVLRSFETCVSANNNLCGKLFSLLELPATFNKSFKVTSEPFFYSWCNLWSSKLDNFTFKVFYWVILY